MKNRKRTYIYILAIFLAAINLRMGITSISPLLETIRKDLNMSNFTVSFLTSIPVLCMGVFALLTGKVYKRWGTEKAIVVCLLLIGAATFMRSFTSSVLPLLITALLIGIGIGLIGPLLSGFIKERFPTKIGLMIGINTFGMVAGVALSSGITVPLQHEFKGSWNMALAFWGIFAIVALFFWFSIMKEDKGTRTHDRQNNRLPLKNKKARLFTLFFGLQAGIFYFVTTWFAPAIQSTGASSQQAGALITLFTLVQMVFTFVIPTLADYYKNRAFWFLGSLCFVLVGLLFMVNPLTTPWLSSILLGIGLGGLFPLALMLPLNAVKTSADAGAWSAMMQSGGYIIGGIIPILAGVIRDFFHGHQQGFIIMALLCVILMIFILRPSFLKQDD
ncbi:MFS transporter, CP family, cyanate transporter [Marininema mesophilum]|uniref:MFS transporter, CP family, cyanate transporter n=1 Tax=Marininema mesophilum TaxID=1048340 RepID=A0A1H2ZN06_9BACL|nr:MFS transporter [Marininema mesophilum]SDX18756.1 MFS transporter, CP family, cyanate transporter [Marininema mesophilum]